MSNQTPPGVAPSSAATGATAETTTSAGRPLGRRQSDRFVGASEANQRTVEQAIAAARARQPVLVSGPAGAGKTHVARAIHAWSARANGPFVIYAAEAGAANARALFGSGPEAGALEEAAGGTLYIRDAEALDDATRSALATALRDGHFQRERGSDAIATDLRLVLGTTSEDELRFGGLELQRVSVAALADRREDIAPLAAHFLAMFTAEEGIPAVGFTQDARSWMLEEDWTGNVRELRARVQQAIRLAGGGALSAESLMLAAEGEDVPSFKEAKRAFETRYVEGLLRRCAGNISKAARLARKDRKDFYDVIRRTGVNPVDFRS